MWNQGSHLWLNVYKWNRINSMKKNEILSFVGTMVELGAVLYEVS